MPRRHARLFLIAMLAWLALASTAFAAPCCNMATGHHHDMPMSGHAAHGTDAPCSCLHATAAVDVAVPMLPATWQPPLAPAAASLVAAVDVAWQPPLRPPAG